MRVNNYQFETRWEVRAPREIIYEILREGKDYPRWWPEVYLDAKYLPAGRTDKLHDRVELLTKGWLPYKLRWTAEVTRLAPPEKIEISASGDFDGRGIWQLEAAGDLTRITFDWRVRADKPLLRLFSFVLKPLFKWNHHWAMSTGLARLRAEASRRLAVQHTEHQATFLNVEEGI